MSSFDISKITKEQALETYRRIMGPPRRELLGEEKSHTLLILKFLDPISESNNQRSLTEVYHQGGKTYHLHYFGEPDDPMIEEVGDSTS